jgi:hypothetical protein
MNDLLNFEFYAEKILKIQTKIHGLQPFRLRKYQLQYLDHLKNDFPSGIVRSIVLKPRQAGFSTLVAGINVHKMATEFNYRGIFLADKFARTMEVHSIYSTFVNNIPLQIRPMLAKNNSDEILFDNPDPTERVTKPGLGSGLKSETAQDENAGRSGTRRWAHFTEYAFYPYALAVDEGVQNSIPLAKDTMIVKETTANGCSGPGEAFYSQWQAAESGDSIYKTFFVPWYFIDDYAMDVPRGFILTNIEIDLVKRCPDITNANLVWRRLKLKEYSSGLDSIYTPEERFCQDFPSYPEEAFLSTGRPVFDLNRLKDHINHIRNNPVQKIEVRLQKQYLVMYPQFLTVFKTPEKGKKYIIGADVAEGVETGDFSNAFVMDTDFNQVAVFHGHIDPDHFGHVLVDLAEVYSKALLVPEINNMGSTTLQAIKNRDYLRVYMRAVYEQIEDSKETLKMGWRTTKLNKQLMLSKLVSRYRDEEIKILDVNLLKEMMNLNRESDGGVELTGKDRVVAACLACVGIDQIYEAATVTVPGKKVKVHFETRDEFRGKIHGKT